MRKLLLIACLIFISTIGFAQIEKGASAFTIQTGLKTEPTRLLVGGGWRYAIFDNLRLSGELNYLFPKNRVMGMNIDANVHYLFCLDSHQEKMYAYPIIGAVMLNNRYMGEKIGEHNNPAKGTTSWGFNLGGGYEYHLSDAIFVNTEIKYIFSKLDAFTWTLGIGFKY